MASSEDQPSWEKLVHRLWERGVRPEKGLQMVVRDGGGGLGGALALVFGSSVVDQRCLFHKLRNVAAKCREDLKGEGKKEERKQLLERGTDICQAESAFPTYLRVVVWGAYW